MTLSLTIAADLVAFWTAAGPKRWYAKDEAFDAQLRLRFEALHHEAAAGASLDWLDEAEGALAYLLLTDQIPRNLYRGSAHAFATDGLALKAAKRAIASGLDRQVEGPIRQFFYLPFEHAEHLADQEKGVRLIEGYAAEDTETGPDVLKFARLHADIIRRFGRFPHRNAMLGRETTAEEQAFLDGGGFRG